MAKKFQFRHQTLLDVAAQRERSVQIEIARAQVTAMEARRRLDATLRLWSEWEGRIRQSQKGLLAPVTMTSLMDAMETLRQRAAKQSAECAVADQQVEAIRERLKEAATARKSYERLRERMHAEYQTEDSRQQVKASDDMASVRAVHSASLKADPIEIEVAATARTMMQRNNAANSIGVTQ